MKQLPTFSFRQAIGLKRARRHFWLSLANAAALPAFSASAGIDQWTGGTAGNWSYPGNWNSGLGPVPGSGDGVNVTSAGGVTQTITYDYTGSAVTLGSLNVNLSGITSGNPSEIVNMSANNLAANTENIGSTVDGSGTFNQSGGANTAGIELGDGIGSTGTYTLSAGSLVSPTEYVGFSGTGIFNQSGGTNASSGTIYVGYVSPFEDGTGTYNLSGTGALSVSFGGFTTSPPVGEIVNGNFNQTGGTNTTNGGDLGLGGSYALGGTGSLSVAGSEDIGGNFVQTGGTNIVHVIVDPIVPIDTAGGDLLVGINPGYYGFGSDTASYTLSAGSLSVAGNEIVGEYGAATFIQSGGTNTSYIDVQSGGTYNLSGTGALVSLGYDESVEGIFNQTGGTNTVTGGGGLFLDTVTGSYNLSGTGTLSAPSEEVAGTFNHSGGTNTVAGEMDIGTGYASGTYALSGTGSLSAATETLGNGSSGNFNQSGGTNSVTGELDVGVYSDGAYALSGGSVAASGGVYVGGGSGGIGGAGTFTLSNTGQLNVTGGLTVYSTGQVTIEGGTAVADSLDIQGGTYTQSGGSATFSNISGNGTATITGGTTTLSLGGAASQLQTLSVGGTGTLDLQLGGETQGVTYDLLEIGGAASLGGTLEIDLVNGFTPDVGDQFTILTAADGVSGEFAGLTSSAPLLKYDVSYGARDNLVEVTITSVPEPGAFMLLAIAGVGLLGRRRRGKGKC